MPRVSSETSLGVALVLHVGVLVVVVMVVVVVVTVKSGMELVSVALGGGVRRNR
jgi:hypothetical protein